MAHKGAVGAASGAEGDADVDGDILLLQFSRGSEGHGAGLQGQGGTLGCHKIVPLQKGAGLLGGFPLGQGPGHQLIRPHTGEHSPGGLLAGKLAGRLVEGTGQNMPALAFFCIVAAGKGLGHHRFGGFALQAKLRLHPALLISRHGNNAPGVILRQYFFVNGQLTGEEVHQALLHGVALVMSDQFQFHPKYPLLPIA